MTFTLTIYRRGIEYVAELREAKYSDEIELVRVFRNERRMKLSDWRRERMYSAFAAEHNIEEKMADARYEGKHRNLVDY